MPNIIRTEAELLALFADNNNGLITAQDLRDFVVSARVDENWYGPQGSQGSQGAQGNQGPQGFAGSQGAQGIRGFQGYQGIQGYQGTQGAGFQGVQGGTGLQGNQGWQGFQGLGYQGIQGNQGAIGVQGAQGRQGNQGLQGLQGNQGAGFQGLQGTQGLQGLQGTQGAAGFQGVQGLQGLQGLQGTQGAGFQGEQGFQGNRGQQGYLGFQGLQGYQGFGLQGLQGNLGLQGVQGAGFQGLQGQRGYQGRLGTILASMAYFNDTLQTISSSTPTKVQWDVLDTDNSKGETGLTFNGTDRFVNTSGADAIYTITGFISWDQGTTGSTRKIYLVKNNNTTGNEGRHAYVALPAPVNTESAVVEFSCNILLCDFDYFEVFVEHDEAGNLDINVDAGYPGSRIVIVRQEGVMGNQGYQGAGFQGEAGLQGNQGIQGFGLQGQQGYQGDGSVLYTNATAVPSTIGGIAVGSTFTNQTMQQMWDALLYPYQSPTFASFSISGQSTPIEVGTTISGTKTFAWSTTNSSNVQTNTVNINDVTNSVVLLTSSANDGSEVITLPSSITKTVPSSHQWQISAVNTNIITFNRTFTVNWYWKIYYGTSSNVTLTESDIESLANSGLVNTYAGSFVYVSGGYKYFCIPDSFGSPNSFKDDATNLTVAMATNSDDVFYSNIANGIYYGLVSVTNVNGNTTNYKVYRTKNILGGSITIDVL
jgi:hypothetical protein